MSLVTFLCNSQSSLSGLKNQNNVFESLCMCSDVVVSSGFCAVWKKCNVVFFLHKANFEKYVVQGKINMKHNGKNTHFQIHVALESEKWGKRRMQAREYRSMYLPNCKLTC